MNRFTLVLATATLLAGSGLAQAEILNFKTDLKATEEVPPAADSKGTGTATFTLDTDTRMLTWEVAAKNLTGNATAAHIHGPAKAGETAPPLIDISAIWEKGSMALTDAQIADLRAGRTYINVHTDKYPDGEIRGQLAP